MQRRDFLHAAGWAAGAAYLYVPTSGIATPPAKIEYIEPNSATGSSLAVVVGPSALAHTTQLLPSLDKSASPGVREQIDLLFANMDLALANAGTELKRAVKINFYLANPDVMKAVKDAMSERFVGPPGPAVSFVVGKLTRSDVVVAADCIATTDARSEPGSVTPKLTPKPLPWTLKASFGNEADVAILPHGAKVYISGDARPGDLREAVQGTMQSLGATLKHLGLDWRHVVQLKTFITPIGGVSVVVKEMQDALGDLPLPPLAFVEWESKLPVEIELIAMMPSEAMNDMQGDTVRYVTPPGMTASPVYSRVAVTKSERTVYVSGLHGPKATDSDGQIHEMFGQLKGVLDKTGSDLKHLVKATYYVATDEVSDRLGKIRPEYYDPQRPPAASKAAVRGVGVTDKTITMDMIAVPK